MSHAASAELTVLDDPEAMSAHAATLVAGLVARARDERGVAHVALSGGSTPVRTYELLAGQLRLWAGVELWFADERCVPPEDEESNYRLVVDALLGGAATVALGEPDAGRVTREPASRGAAGASTTADRAGGTSRMRARGAAGVTVHRMQGELGPETGADRYAAALTRRLAQLPPGVPVLDAVLLGIGPEGHIASLFPNSPALSAAPTQPCLAVHDSPKPPPERITLSMSVLQAARRCVLLASGHGKAQALRDAVGDQSPGAPASLLPRARLSVVADRAAAALVAQRSGHDDGPRQ